MTRRKAGLDDGSLELLLDTICNTFGGVIFISLLLSLIIDSSKGAEQPTPEPVRSAAELSDAEAARERLAAELLRLRVAADSAAATAEALALEDAIAVAEELESWERKRAELVGRKSAAIGSINRDRIAMQEAQEQAEAKKSTLEKAKAIRDELAQEEAQIRAAIATTADELSRSASAPKLEYRQDLRTIDFTLQRGRLYGPLFHPVSGRNDVDYEFVDADGNTIITCRPASGLAVAADGTNVDALAAKIAVGSPERYAIHLHVMPDSYRAYDPVRTALERAGYRSAVVPWPEDAVFVLGEGEARKTQ